MFTITSVFVESYIDRNGKLAYVDKTRYVGLNKKLFPSSYKMPQFKTGDEEVAESCVAEWPLAPGERNKDSRRVIFLA